MTTTTTYNPGRTALRSTEAVRLLAALTSLAALANRGAARRALLEALEQVSTWAVPRLAERARVHGCIGLAREYVDLFESHIGAREAQLARELLAAMAGLVPDDASESARRFAEAVELAAAGGEWGPAIDAAEATAHASEPGLMEWLAEQLEDAANIAAGDGGLGFALRAAVADGWLILPTSGVSGLVRCEGGVLRFDREAPAVDVARAVRAALAGRVAA